MDDNDKVAVPGWAAKWALALVQGAVLLGGANMMKTVDSIETGIVEIKSDARERSGRIDRLEEFLTKDTARLPGAAPASVTCKAEYAQQFAILMAAGIDPSEAWDRARAVPCNN